MLEMRRYQLYVNESAVRVVSHSGLRLAMESYIIAPSMLLI